MVGVRRAAAARRRSSSASRSRGVGPLIGSGTTSTSSAGTTSRAPSVSSVTRPVRPLISTIRPVLPSVRDRPKSPTRGCGARLRELVGGGRRSGPAPPLPSRPRAARRPSSSNGRRHSRHASPPAMFRWRVSSRRTSATSRSARATRSSAARRASASSSPGLAACPRDPARAQSRSVGRRRGALGARRLQRRRLRLARRAAIAASVSSIVACSAEIRARASARIAAGRPSRSAIANAWLLPGRPIVSRYVGRSVVTSNSTAAFVDAGVLGGEALQLGVVGRRRDHGAGVEQPATIAIASADPSAGSVPAPTSSSRTSVAGPAARRSARRCAGGSRTSRATARCSARRRCRPSRAGRPEGGRHRRPGPAARPGA